ncbi:MAG: hypothetical protein HY796_12295 [Elusimicrobia bacterium]|nr:hypothetical protein [Elusimicrobiota bacterium]
MDKPTPWVFILFSLAMGIVIMTFPYLFTMLNRFNKERRLIWRRFLSVISICYLPIIVILYAVSITNPRNIGPKMLLPWWIGYYFAYIVFTTFIKKRLNLELGWLKFISSATTGYLLVTFLLVFISALFDDPLICLFSVSAVNYITSP